MKEDADLEAVDKTGNKLDAAHDFVSSLEFKTDSLVVDLENDEVVKIPFDVLSVLGSGLSRLNVFPLSRKCLKNDWLLRISLVTHFRYVL